MRGFLRRLFAGSQARQTVPPRDGFFLDVECGRCGERFHLYISRSTDCLQVFDEPGVAWRLQREIVGAGCRAVMQVRIDLAPDGKIIHREISLGRFLEAGAGD